VTLLEVGRIARPHGLRGEVVVELSTNRLERLAPGAVLVVRGGPGTPPSLEVRESRPFQARHLVWFVGVTDRAGADALHGATLLAEPLAEEGAWFVHELIGARVVDQNGIDRGRITAVEANPASDLLVVDDTHYVPMGFVSSFANGRVDVDVPDGLFG
jgi:16S rRNA processing protein RimM